MTKTKQLKPFRSRKRQALFVVMMLFIGIKAYEHLQKAFPDVDIIEVLPKENVSKIGFRAPVLYSIDIRELAAMIANTDVFIGADSGVMHLAISSLTPTGSLFSLTDTEKYKPYNEGSVAVKTNEVEIDELIVLVENALYPDLIPQLETYE